MSDFCKRLEEDGFFYYTVDSNTKDLIRLFLDLSKNFFSMPENQKRIFSFNGLISGYREVGVEYASTISRPDLNESFSVRKSDADTLLSLNEIREFLTIAYALQESLDVIAQEVLSSISSGFGAESLLTDLNSWLQVNYYKPSAENRDFLQDEHEDGHLLTLVTATQNGLQYKIKTGYVPVDEIDIGKLLVMPGDILSLLTGNKIKPLFHRVKRHPEVNERFSIMYFVNPNKINHIPPWINNEFNRNINIAEKSVKSQLKFGLPSL